MDKNGYKVQNTGTQSVKAPNYTPAPKGKKVVKTGSDLRASK